MEYKTTTVFDFSYIPVSDIILIGISPKVYDKLTDNELLEYIADSLTHEHIHRALFKIFDLTVTKLFDTIQQHFRNVRLHEKIINTHNQIYSSSDKMTHEKFIKDYGLNAFFREYRLSIFDVNDAEILCNYRS